jgi:hypothetical protein
MALPASGAIAFSDINVELNYSSTAQISLNDSAVRTLFSIASGAIDMNTGYGKSASLGYIEDIFSTYLYTGNGATQTITNGIDLSTKGGMVWLKKRGAGTGDHEVFDTLRGATNRIIPNVPNSTNAQITNANSLTSFNTNGFSIGSYSEINGSGDTQVSWTFRKQPKFFDVVTFTSNSLGGGTFSHNLGSTPGFIVTKSSSTADQWTIYHRSLGTSGYMYLNSTSANTPVTGFWSVSSTSVTYANDYGPPNASMVAYLFAHNTGSFGLTGTDNVISCGSYTTDGSGNATINLGYEPQWLMTKASSTTSDWRMFDNMRGFVATGDSNPLAANSSRAEDVGTYGTGINLTSTGFNSNATSASQTFIYIAIRRGPMKVPTDATKVFKPNTRTGTGANATVTGIGFVPDLTVIPYRTSTVGQDGPAWFDRLRGKLQWLKSAATDAEVAQTDTLTSFNMSGVSLGPDTSNYVINYSSGQTYVDYFFGRAPSFFDVVCYTGTGSATTKTHNLGVVPELIIFKTRSTATNWYVYAATLGQGYCILNFSDPFQVNTTTFMNNTTPTSSVFTVGTDVGQTNPKVNVSGATYVAYLFATCAGVSKVGSYTGNGTTQTINCGFTAGARFVLIKRTNALGDWYVYDTARGMTTLTDPYLTLDTTDAETATLGSVTTVSTGFALNSTILAAINVSGGTYIFLAIA